MSPFRLLSTLLAVAPCIHAAIPNIPNFTLTWSDDFIGTANSLPSTSNWIVDTGTSYRGGAANWGTGEIQTYTSSPSNLALDGNGNLLITPLRSKSGAWTSARIETQRLNFMAADRGKMRIQASISMPDVTGNAASGYWPAFWTLGGAYRGNYQNWPSTGEFDIMENVNGLNTVYGTLHCDVNPGGKCSETNGISKGVQCPGTPCQGNFHTYSFTVDRSVSPETMTWMVDSTIIQTVTETQVGSAVWKQIAHNGHFILLNV
jgi:beta-glucanase (GH16 family)